MRARINEQLLKTSDADVVSSCKKNLKKKTLRGGGGGGDKVATCFKPRQNVELSELSSTSGSVMFVWMSLYRPARSICLLQTNRTPEDRSRDKSMLDFRRFPGPVFDLPAGETPSRGWMRTHFPEQRLAIEPGTKVDLHNSLMYF